MKISKHGHDGTVAFYLTELLGNLSDCGSRWQL